MRQFGRRKLPTTTSGHNDRTGSRKPTSPPALRMGDTARVQQIMVLFTDGRFEAFTPADQ